VKLIITSDLFSEIKEIPPILNQKTYPSLNGLRAISILMVIVYHLMLGYAPSFSQFFYIGPLGVDVFFVISGFLITTLCLKEKITTGNLSLKSFYIRRALRILPVAYLYIIVVIILSYIFKLHIAPISVITAIFFVVNIPFSTEFTWNLAHYWSLSVEEQFYLFFPVFIKKRFNVFIGLLLFICFIVPPIVCLKSMVPILDTGIMAYVLPYLVKLQGISIGCLFSILLFKGYLNFGKFKLLVSLLSIFIIFFLHFKADYGSKNCLTNLVISIFIGFIIVNNIQPQNNVVFKFLNLKALNFIGILSYSIYVWQQLFLSNDSKFVLSKFPLNLVFIVIVPLLSYFYFEKFFLKFKTRFIKVKV
jgi:peptidoglycan/LPS O-acetylase OafA/YrhL